MSTIPKKILFRIKKSELLKEFIEQNIFFQLYCEKKINGQQTISPYKQK